MLRLFKTTATDRVKLVRNRIFGGVFVLSRCFLDFSVGVKAFNKTESDFFLFLALLAYNTIFHQNMTMIFSAPEPRLMCTIVITNVHVVRRPLLTFNIFDFSKTAEQNVTKLDRKQDLNVLYKVCVFRANWMSQRAALASDWLRHFYFSETAERNSTQLDRRQDR